MKRFMRSLISASLLYVVGMVVERGAQSRQVAKRTVGGIVMMVIGFIVGAIAVQALVFSIFFYLAGYLNLGRAAIITTIIAVIVALFALMQGRYIFGKK